MTRFLALFVMLSAWSCPAWAQTSASDMTYGMKVVSVRSADRDGAWIIDVFVRSDLAHPVRPGRYPPLHSARFRRGLDETRDRWADARSCPTLIGVVAGLDGVFAPRFAPSRPYGVAPEGAEMPAPLMGPIHGQTYTIEGRAIQADGSMAQMSISSSSGGIADFGRRVERQLANCWTEQPPAD